MLGTGTVLSDRYEIKEKIGAGGMSIVYKAKCRKLQRYVAIKVLRDEFAQDESFVSKFKAEALSAASLSHPNIVGIYDVGHDNGYHYIVMEYVEGKTLKELIDEEAPYDTQTVLEYGMEIVSAIRHAHRKKIIHRDIKPQNILVTNDRILKVTDFGIARAVDSATIVSTGTAIGSVHYFSPEQAKGKYVNETSDLYSCGIVLFELATGRLPFEADSHVSVALKHINEQLPLPTTFNQQLSSSLEAIIVKATQKRSELRYQNAGEMLYDMKQLSIDPSYKIASAVSQINQPTILMTSEETDFIRKNAQDAQGLNIPYWNNINGEHTLQAMPVTQNEVIEDKNENEEEVSTAYTVMVTIAGILAAMVLIGIVTAFALPWFGKMNAPKVVAVPNLIEKDVATATSELKNIGLEIDVVREEYKEGVMPGRIIVQAPLRDEIVPLGSKVEVIVSKEQEIITTTVPDVIGMDFADAQVALENEKLVVAVERIYNEQVEQGRVISQSPQPRSTAEVGEKVTVVVSKGPEIIKVSVPNVMNKEEKVAIQMLKDAGLTVGKVTQEENDAVEKGYIISQGIPAGTEVQQSSTVSLIVSTGKKEEPKPAVKNLTIGIPAFLEQKEAYHVLIRLISENGESKTIYDGQVRWEEFPIPVSVKGTGRGTVETYIDNDRVYVDPIDFDEVTQ